MLIFEVFLGHMKVCDHHMKVCGCTPSKDEEHMKNTKNTMSFKLRFRCFTSNKLIDGVIHVLDALRVFYVHLLKHGSQSSSMDIYKPPQSPFPQFLVN